MSPPLPEPERALNNNIRMRETVEVPNKMRLFVSDPILCFNQVEQLKIQDVTGSLLIESLKKLSTIMRIFITDP